MTLLIPISLAVVLLCTFIILHTRSLNEAEITALATKRREKQLRLYFTFSGMPIGVSLEFKKNMAPNGKFYDVREQLSHFPSLAASLLKYKKHEWMLVAMEKDNQVKLL
jgi:hypothetical protein